MHTAAITEPGAIKAAPSRSNMEVEIGQQVRLLSGQLAGLEGIVVRHEQPDSYVIGVPTASSGVLIRVHRQRFRPYERRVAPSR